MNLMNQSKAKEQQRAKRIPSWLVVSRTLLNEKASATEVGYNFYRAFFLNQGSILPKNPFSSHLFAFD